MSEWVDLSTVVSRLASSALLTSEESGLRLQVALARGEIRTRTAVLQSRPAGGSDSDIRSDAFQDDVEISPELWRAVEVDWSSRYLHCVFHDGPTLHVSGDIEAHRAEALAFLRRLNDVSGTEQETSVLPEASIPIRRNTGGRRPTWDWEGAYIEMARILILEEEGVDRARLNARVADWFVQQTGSHPAESMIRDKVRRMHESVWPPAA